MQDTLARGSAAPVGFDELRSLMRIGAVTLVDVLPRASFDEQRLPGSINLPMAEIPDRARRVLPDPDAEIVVYCGGFN